MSGENVRRTLRFARLLILPVALVFSLVSAERTNALSLPLVSDLLHTLLPLQPSSPGASPQPQDPAPTSPTQPAENPPAQTASPASSQVLQPAATSTPETLPQLTVTAPDVEPLPDNSLATVQVADDDVLARRIQNAAVAAKQSEYLAPARCPLFFGQCWYVVTPAAALVAGLVLATYYLLQRKVSHRKTLNPTE